MRPLGGKPRGAAEALIIPAGALAVSLILFGIFVAFAGANPLAVYRTIYRGAFGSWFSWQNTLQRAAPLMLTALCTALPAQVGLIVIGGEGALIIGAVATVAMAAVLPGVPPPAVVAAMLLAGMGAGGLWIALAGGLRHYRGVNETISSLLLNYIAIALITCSSAAETAGLGGMPDIAAVHGRARSSLGAGYGYTGILVAFLARPTPLAVIPVAILLRGIEASGGLMQRWHDLPDATVLVVRGIIFLVILASEPLYGRFRIFQQRTA